MGNVPSRTNAYPGSQNNPDNNSHTFDVPDGAGDRHRSILLTLLDHFSRHRPGAAPNPVPTVRSASVERPATSSPLPSNINRGSRYNLRRTVARIRREGQRFRDSLNVRESSISTQEINQDFGVAAAPMSADTSSQSNSTDARRRPRPEAEHAREESHGPTQRPRLAGDDLLSQLRLGDDEDGRSVFFTFPLRGEGGAVRHLVLVRVRHIQGAPPLPTGEMTGILQWTLFFLVPPQQADDTSSSQPSPPSSINIDAAQVLTEAFAAFNSLINDDRFSYEELTRLQEMMGFVSRGVTDEVIAAQLKTVPFKIGMENVGPNCAICLAQYEADETCRRLPCDHFYHSECIDKWLNQVNQCPLCRREAVQKTPPAATPADFIIPPEDLD